MASKMKFAPRPQIKADIIGADQRAAARLEKRLRSWGLTHIKTTLHPQLPPKVLTLTLKGPMAIGKTTIFKRLEGARWKVDKVTRAEFEILHNGEPQETRDVIAPTKAGA